MKNLSIVLQSPGDVSQFEAVEQAVPQPGAGEVVIRQEAIGVNFLDIYQRKGIYALPSYPAVIGAEAAGTIVALGEGVERLAAGDHVAYAGPPIGAYCSLRTIAAERVIKLPADVSMETAAVSLLKGMTAVMLLEKTFAVKSGDTVLVHAAAGGLGSILVRGAKARGATVIGVTSTAEKAEIARSLGADHVIVGREIDLAKEVKQLTEERGVDVAYDGIGGDMLVKTLRSVRPFGTAVTVGQAGGPIPPISVEELRPGKNLSHPSIMAWCSEVARYREVAEAAIRDMTAGIASDIGGTYPLVHVAKAHEAMEAGRTTGSLLLIP
ncbi:quinone oxidoreductase family protein [Oryzifoliimicrobium ureilyticus]|uniref:quinone oxidoreductase family protein n=1 Tax=Oryzifoliimicrobium ureilyticus TaxID=3113724 RepID=UPI00307610A6